MKFFSLLTTIYLARIPPTLCGAAGQPAAGANTSSDAAVRYYVKDAPGYYLERNYGATGAPNTDGIYLILITPDGTRYRLGYFADAEEWQHAGWGGNMSIAGHPGHTPGGYSYSAIAWHVDTVTDAFGNQMTYHYYTWNTDENIQWWNTDHWTSFALTTRKNRINDIKYNYPTRVTSLPAADTVARLTSTPATRIAFRSANTTYYPTLINSIFIYHGGGANPISEYRIDTTGVLVDSLGCLNEDTQPNTYRQSHTRIVKSIRRYVNTDGDATTNDAGYALPPTTFYYGNNLNNQAEYNPLRHFTWAGQPCFRFLYLHGYKNGYGGSVRFTYSSDDRSVGEYQYITYNRYTWPTIGFSYVVSEMRANDGRNADLRTTYTYTQRCYAQWGAVPSGAVNCAEPNAPEQYGPLVGHYTTTQTSYDYNGSTVLNKQITTFSQNATNSIGRPTQVQFQNSGGTTLTQSNHTYTSLTINGLPNMFTYTSETRNYQYNGGNTLSSKTTYEYNSANQGSAQYGNLTHIRQYDSASAATPIRTTARWYYPRAELNGSGVLTGHWLVGLVGAESLYSGNMSSQINGAWYYYDNDSDHLGSASLLVNGSNNPVAGSRTWYLPFGGYRPGSAPTQTITDRDFTGQRESWSWGCCITTPGTMCPVWADSSAPTPSSPCDTKSLDEQLCTLTNDDITWCSATSTLPRRASLATAGCEALGTT